MAPVRANPCRANTQSPTAMLLIQAVWTPPVAKLRSIISSPVVDSGSLFGLLGSYP